MVNFAFRMHIGCCMGPCNCVALDPWHNDFRMNWWATNSCSLDSLRFCANFQKRLVKQHNTKVINLPLIFSTSKIFYALHSDRVLCHFCFKPKKVTNEVLSVDSSRKSQALISSVILLKTALDALPLLSKVTVITFLIVDINFIWLVVLSRVLKS